MFRCVATGIWTQGRSWGLKGTLPLAWIGLLPKQSTGIPGTIRNKPYGKGIKLRVQTSGPGPTHLPPSMSLGLMTDVHMPQGSPVNQVMSSPWVTAVPTVPGLSHSLQPHAHIGELCSPQLRWTCLVGGYQASGPQPEGAWWTTMT